MDDLEQKLLKANEAYHNGEPIMTDVEFDTLVAKWETQTGRKWSERAGVGALPRITSVPLPMWMGSMNKIKEEKDIIAWKTKFNPDSIIVCDKLDGISCLLHWIPSKPDCTRLFTRGNGTLGTDITPLLNVVPSFIKCLKTLENAIIKDNEYEFFLRGELIISRSNWESQRTTIWNQYKNPRNTVAGLIGRKLSSHSKKGLEALKQVDFIPFTYDTKNHEGTWNLLLKSEMFLNMEKRLGLDKNDYVWSQRMNSSTTLTKQYLSKILLERKIKSKYEIDGIIIWDNEHAFEPNSSGNPERAFAFKMIMDDQKAETLVTGVEWNISRTGVWKPVVLFEPVTIGGTRICRSTGNNATWLINRGIGIGSKIVLIRSGDVIPKIQDVIHTVSQDKLPMPPDGTWKWDTNKTDIIGTGDMSSYVSSVSTQASYVSSTLNIKSLSKQSLKKYVQTHLNSIQCLPFPQMFPLVATEKEWMKVDGVQETNAKKFVKRANEAWNSANHETQLIALGLLPRGIGKKQVQSMKIQKVLNVLLGNSQAMDKHEVKMILQGTAGWGPTRVGLLMNSFDKIQKGFQWALRNISTQSSYHDKKAPPIMKMDDKLKRVIDEIGDKQYILFTGFRNDGWQNYLETTFGKQFIHNLRKKDTKDTTIVFAKDGKRSSKVAKAESKGIKIVYV